MNKYIERINRRKKKEEKGMGEEKISVSMFSGGGGLDLGLWNAGFEIKYASDKEKYYCETLRENYPGCYVEEKDIKEINANSIYEKTGKKEIELLSGGSPCQSFSILGQRKSLEDERGQLVFEFIRLIKELRPSVFIFENVPGILSVNKGKDWELIRDKFKETGYRIKEKVLNAADYGIPQTRKRLFVIGFREEVEFEFPIPTHRKPSKAEEYPNIFREVLQWLPAKLVFEDNKDLPNNEIRPHSERVIERYKLVEQGSKDKIDRTKRIDGEKPAGTVVVGSKSGGGRPHIHPYLPRQITVREGARLQSFPDWYIFKGTQTAQYRQVGNAVPPLLAYEIGKEIKKALKRSK